MRGLMSVLYERTGFTCATEETEVSMLHLIWYLIVGFIAGLIARAVLPGADHMGLLMTTLLGIVGSVLGGFISRLFSKPSPDAKFHPAGIIMSIIGAIVVLLLLRFLH